MNRSTHTNDQLPAIYPLSMMEAINERLTGEVNSPVLYEDVCLIILGFIDDLKELDDQNWVWHALRMRVKYCYGPGGIVVGSISPFHRYMEQSLPVLADNRLVRLHMRMLTELCELLNRKRNPLQ